MKRIGRYKITEVTLLQTTEDTKNTDYFKPQSPSRPPIAKSAKKVQPQRHKDTEHV